MNNTEYYIQSIQGDINPDVGERRLAGTHVELEIGEGNYDPEEDLLQTEATFELEFYSVEDHEGIDEGEELPDPSYGYVEFEMDIIVRDLSEEVDNDVSLSEEMDAWADGNYPNIDSNIIMNVEGGFVENIVAPTGQLLDDAFYGIMPIYRFTEAPDDDDSDPSDET